MVKTAAFGLVCGGVGGSSAGAIFGAIIVTYTKPILNTPTNSLFDLLFPLFFVATLYGLVGGLVVGSILGLLAPYLGSRLLSLARLVGGATTALASLLLVNLFETPVGVLLMALSATVCGVLGASIAVRCFERLSGLKIR